MLHLPAYFFLMGDSFGGAYEIGKSFFEGKGSVLHQWAPPGIPVVLSLLNFFPEIIHPYLRILISEILTILNMYLAFKIYSKILSQKAIICGLIVSLFNPLYIWWVCLRAGPDIYIAVFLGLIIYSTLNLINNKITFHLYILLFTIPISLLFKPVLFLIPLFLILYFFINKKYKLSLASTFILIISIFSLKITMDVSNPVKGPTYAPTTFMIDPIFTDVLFHTGKFGYYNEDMPEETQNPQSYLYKFDKTLKEYNSKDYSDSEISIIMHYASENIGYLLLSKLLNPLYFISVSNTTQKTLFLLVLNSAILSLSILNLKRLKKYFPEQISKITFVFLGYYFVFFLVHSCARYSIPLLFYISVFSGVSIYNWIGKIKFVKTSGGGSNTKIDK